MGNKSQVNYVMRQLQPYNTRKKKSVERWRNQNPDKKLIKEAKPQKSEK